MKFIANSLKQIKDSDEQRDLLKICLSYRWQIIFFMKMKLDLLNFVQRNGVSTETLLEMIKDNNG